MTSTMRLEPITAGPKYHWFGYYDKRQLDLSGRYALGMEVDFEHRSPRPDDVISVGVIDLEAGNPWTELGHSSAWCWQQGCMLQWRPGSDRQVMWNDRQDGRFVCHILDTQTGARRTLPFPFYTVAPDGVVAYSTDFRRVNDMRPGYGYPGIPDPNSDSQAPDDSGIWRLDLDRGEPELIVAIAEVAAIPYPHGDLSEAKHYFNHLLINPDGTRLEFLHRWRTPESQSFHTRMLTCAPDGRDIRVVDDCGLTSHFIWKDADHILAWSRAHSERGDFCLFDERTGSFEAIGSAAMTQDGHVNCLPHADWLVNDTYPGNRREQGLYLYHVPGARRIDLMALHAPPEYQGEWRCDLHPRLSPDGCKVIVDSAHDGGRQMYVLDICDIPVS